MRRELIQCVTGKNVYIQTHNFPDPDAFASAYALQCYLKYYNIDSQIIYYGRVDRVNSVKMLENFGIEAIQADKTMRLTKDDYVILVDAQNQNSNVHDLGGYVVACIDHHPVSGEYTYQYEDNQKTGACASILASYFKEDNIPMQEELASALAYAIKMDTADFTRGTQQIDTNMFSYLYSMADWKRIQEMYTGTLELSDLKAYEAAISNIKVIEQVGFAYIPFECQPVLIAIISDFVRALAEVEVAVIYAKQNEGVKFSIRSERADVHVGVLVKRALADIGDGGGHMEMAGGYMPQETVEECGEDLHEIIKSRFMKEIREMKEHA